jgi:hypothetical protein
MAVKRSARRVRTTSGKGAAGPKARGSTRKSPAARGAKASPIEVREIESLRGELRRIARSTGPPRWNADPEDVRRSVAKLVLTLVELIRQLLERQAIRRMEARTLTAEETEAIGLALMRLEETVRDLAAQFGLSTEDLNLDLGPIGRLM